ncbi:MAG: amino acid permease [Bacteroidota bacterium]
MSIQSKLGRFDLIMIIVSLVIGIGIFKTPSIVAEKAGSPLIFYLAWIIGGIISIFGALTFAEIGARLPVAGGFYKIFSHCYHPAFAFMLNWSLVIINAGSAVAVALVGAEYIKPVIVPAEFQDSISSKMIALAALSILFLLNYIGIKMGSRVQNILSGIKIVLILLFCMSVFGTHHISSPAAVAHSTKDSLMALGVCLISVFFTFGGYQMTINLGADIKDPQKNIPLAIFSGISIILVLYLMINIAYCEVLGFENLGGKTLIASELAAKYFGEAGFKITSIVIFISTLGFLNTSFMVNPRIYYAMAEDKILPSLFKRVNEKTQTQEFAVCFFFGLTIISLFLLDAFEKIVNYVMFIDSISLVFAAATIFILRKRMALSDYSGFRMKFFPFIPALFMIALMIVCINVLIFDIKAATIGMGIFLAGFPLYQLILFIARRKS